MHTCMKRLEANISQQQIIKKQTILSIFISLWRTQFNKETGRVIFYFCLYALYFLVFFVGFLTLF